MTGQRPACQRNVVVTIHHVQMFLFLWDDDEMQEADETHREMPLKVNLQWLARRLSQ